MALRVEGADGLGMETLIKEHYKRLLSLNGGWRLADMDLMIKDQPQKEQRKKHDKENSFLLKPVKARTSFLDLPLESRRPEYGIPLDTWAKMSGMKLLHDMEAKKLALTDSEHE